MWHILQIMDSKMDSGYVRPGENFEQALEYNYDVTRDLSPSEVIGVMDQLLSHEVCRLMFRRTALDLMVVLKFTFTSLRILFSFFRWPGI